MRNLSCNIHYCMGKITLCVNLAGPWDAQTLFWVILWGHFWMRLTDCLRYWGWAASNELKFRENKRITFLWVQENFLSMTSFKLRYQLYSYLWTQTDTSALLGFQACHTLDWNYTISFSRSPTCGFGLKSHHQLSWVCRLLTHLQMFGLSSLHNHYVSQFLTISKKITNYILLVLFPWKPLLTYHLSVKGRKFEMNLKLKKKWFSNTYMPWRKFKARFPKPCF
jgi:hypothetical protein